MKNIKLLKSSLTLFIPVQFTSWIISRLMRTQWAMGELFTHFIMQDHNPIN